MNSFKLDFEVRDSEIDIQGVVNNANYFIYLEHARHKFAQQLGLSFTKMAEENQFLYLIEAKITYKKSLRPADMFYVTSRLVPEGKIRFAFEQEIRLSDDDSLIAKAHNICVCIDGRIGKPYLPDILKKYMD